MKADKLKNITLKITDGKHGDCRNQDDSGYYFISCKDIYDEFIHYENARQITKDDFIETDRRTNLAANDILITNSGTIGRMAYVKDLPETRKTTFQKSVAIIKADNNIVNPQYLFYLLKSKVGDFVNSSNGSAQKNLLLSTMRNFEIVYSENKTIQHRIATILSRYDSLIENYRKQIKLLEEAAQCLYKEWFVDFRFPGHEKIKIVDGVPEGWEKSCIADVTTKVTTGLNPRKNFVLGHGHNYYVTIKNMGENTFSLDEKCDRVDDEALTKINKRSKIKIGDILFSGIGTIGRVALIDIPTSNWNVSESVFTMRANDYISKEFLYLLLLDSKMQNYCQSHSHGAAQKGIRMADLKSFAFPLAPKGILDTFTSKVKPLLDTITKLRHQIRLLTEARDLLLPKLMSGEIEM